MFRTIELGKTKDQYYYGGQCKHCGNNQLFLFDLQREGNKEVSWKFFYRRVAELYFPSWMMRCDQCKNIAVFELTAIQDRNPKVEE